MRKMVILIHKIPQTDNSLGRVLDNLGKDIRTVASGVAGTRDSTKVYAVRHVDAGYTKAVEFAMENDVKNPMM